MRNQQQAQKLEQKRIKDIVLNLDLRDEGEVIDGEDPFSFPLERNPNRANPLRNVHYGADAVNRTAAIYSSSVQSRQLSRTTFASASSSRSSAVSRDSKSSSANVQNLPTHTSTQGSLEKNPPNPYLAPRVDKAGKSRAAQRGRRLEVSDLDWSDKPQHILQSL